MKFVDIPTAVEACFDEEGRVTPTAFHWRGRDVHISDVGRRWIEPHGPHQLRHYLVMTPTQDTFELCLDTGTMQWKIVRVWERDRKQVVITRNWWVDDASWQAALASLQFGHSLLR